MPTEKEKTERKLLQKQFPFFYGRIYSFRPGMGTPVEGVGRGDGGSSPVRKVYNRRGGNGGLKKTAFRTRPGLNRTARNIKNPRDGDGGSFSCVFTGLFFQNNDTRQLFTFHPFEESAASGRDV